MTSIRAPYSSPPILSLITVVEEEAKAYEADKSSSRLSLRHKISYAAPISDTMPPDLGICDLLHPDEPILIRMIESFDPVRHKLIPAKDARLSILRNHRIKDRRIDLAIITLPRGCEIAYGERTCAESCLAVIPFGHAAFSESGGEIISEIGISGIIFAALPFGKDAERKLDAILCDLLPAERFKESSFYLCCTDESKRDATIDLLLAHTASCGAVMSSASPFMLINECAAEVRYLTETGRREDAGRILDFLFSTWNLRKHIGAAEIESPDIRAPIIEGSNGNALAYASVINAFLDYAEITGDNDFVRSRMPILISSAKALCSAVCAGKMRYSGFEAELRHGVIPRSAAICASSEVTLEALSASKRLIAFTRELALRNRERYFPPLVKLARELERSFRGDFIHGDILYSHAPTKASNERRPRFFFGLCEACAERGVEAAPAMLEFVPNVGYLCPHCMASNNTRELLSGQDIDSPAVMTLPPISAIRLGVFTHDEAERLILPCISALESIEKPRDLPLTTTAARLCELIAYCARESADAKEYNRKNAEIARNYAKSIALSPGIWSDTSSGVIPSPHASAEIASALARLSKIY